MRFFADGNAKKVAKTRYFTSREYPETRNNRVTRSGTIAVLGISRAGSGLFRLARRDPRVIFSHNRLDTGLFCFPVGNP